jgi:D-lyxose ketol-isomerase
MLINEPEIAAHAIKIVPKLWGSEFWMVNNELYCMKYLKVNPGYQCSVHAHAIKDETFVGFTGTLQLTLYDSKGKIVNVLALDPGAKYRIRPETFHSFQAINVTWVMEISTQHSDKDVIRLQESRRLTT